MPLYDPRVIANEFLRRSSAAGRRLTHMQLQKLVYLAHGWNFASDENALPLVREDFEAWDWGPVQPRLYHSLKRYGSSPIDEPIALVDGGPPMEGALNAAEIELLDAVFEGYGGWSGPQLSELTHREGTPWRAVYEPNHRRIVIDNDSIRQFFVAQAADATAA